MKSIQSCGLVALACLLISTVPGEARTSPRGAGQPLTMLVFPAQYTLVQIAMDIDQHYPSVLVSYQSEGVDQDPVLHAWNGREWLYISCDDFLAGRFVRTLPERVVLIGPEDETPSLLADGPLWTPLLVKIPATRTPRLINALGRVFDFTPFTWHWFAARYRLELRDTTAPSRHVSWYDGSFEPEVMPDGSIRKRYIPPATLDEPDYELFEVDSITRPVSTPSLIIPLKAEPLRMADTYDMDYEDLADDFLLPEAPVPQPPAPAPAPVIEQPEGERSRAVLRPSPRTEEPLPPPRERSIFFEYTEEDMRAMERQK